MDIQLKRGLLDVAVLSAARRGETYGYKIIKDLAPDLLLTESTLYTILKRLEGGGMLASRSAEYNGRIRRYYRITEKGLARIEEFKADWQEILAIHRLVTNGGESHE